MVQARGSRTSWLIALALLALLVALGVLQHRWLGQIRAAERERTLARLQSAAARFAADFDQELARLAGVFAPPRGPHGTDPGDVAERLARWERFAHIPDLVREVFVARVVDGTGRVGVARVDRTSGRTVPTEWPASLTDLAARLAVGSSAPGPFPGPRARGGGLMAAADIPALIVPLASPLPSRLHDPLHRPPPAVPGGAIVIWLDMETIQQRLLPDLTARHFGGPGGIEHVIEIVPASDPARVIFSAGPSSATAPGSHPEVVADLFALRPFGPPGPEEPGGSPPGPAPSPRRGAWRLVVGNPDGVLEASVARAQRWNAILGFGILGVLAATMGLLLVTTHRARRLAQQQIEFVAGVTHELRTPLTALRSAGQNLAHGVVRDGEQVRKYGALIDREAHRLGELVGQVLEFAGLQAGRTRFVREPVAVAEVIREALAECQPALEEAGLRVQTDCAPLPELMGDASALRRALVNLIGNALKYAAAGGGIGIRARSGGSSLRGVWVEIAVEDRGPGIAPADLPHIFEPFTRGRERAASSVPGSGLGLTIVRRVAEAHGGRVTVRSEPGHGATFTLILPARPGSEPAATADTARPASSPSGRSVPGDPGGTAPTIHNARSGSPPAP